MAKDLILAIDIGSSGIRAALFDDSTKRLSRTAVKLPISFETNTDGTSQLDEADCLASVVSAIDTVLERSSRVSGDITAVAMCSFWHGVVGVDERGRPTTKVLTWADTRSREYSAVLKKRFDEDIVHQRTGAHFHSSFWPAKLMWFRRERPSVWERTAKWLSFSDHLAAKLFGESVTSVSMASATGIVDQHKCDWDSELLRYLKVKRTQLSRIASDGESFGLNRKYARRWPQLAAAKWFPAIGDGAADHSGSCGIVKHAASLMVGTSAAMRTAYEGTPPKPIPKGLWCYRIDHRRVVIGGALSDGGNLFALLKERFRLSGDLEKELASRQAADGLVVIPFFFGERSIGYDENAHGAIVGMTAEHDGIDVLRAAMEGVAFRLADIFERLNRFAKIKTIAASGGALRESPFWTQVIADTLGRDLTVSDADESSLRGAALYVREMMS